MAQRSWQEGETIEIDIKSENKNVLSWERNDVIDNLKTHVYLKIKSLG